MNNNIKLLIGAGSAVFFGICALNGCSSDSDSGSTAGAAGTISAAGSAGIGAGNAGSAGAASNVAGTDSGGAGVAGAATGGASGSTAGGGGATVGSGGSTAGSGGASGGAAGSTAGSGGAAAGSGGAAAGSGGTGGAPSAACTTFCNDEETVCMFTGDTAAYASKAACFSGCATFTPGTGNTGNTLSCRQYHVTNAKTMPKDVHCPHTALISHNKGSAATAADGPCN